MLKSMGATDDVKLATATAALKSEIAQRRNLEVELLKAVEAERQRIGQDLHDELCQDLGATALVAGSLAKQVAMQDSELGAKVSEIPELISKAIQSCRNLAKGLHPVTLERDGLPAALEELGAQVPHHITFRWPQSERINFERSVALHLYRIAEEAMGNALKHAEAKRITIALNVKGGRGKLIITDDGKGLATKTKSKGMGMRNMKYRASVIGAELTVKGGKGCGTTVCCSFPFSMPPEGGRNGSRPE